MGEVDMGGSKPADAAATARISRATGVALLAMAALGVFANFMVLDRIIVDGDPSATARAAAESVTLLRLGAVAFLAVAVLDVVVAVGLHRLLAPVAPGLSLTAAAVRVAYAAVLVAAVGQLPTEPDAVGSGGVVESFAATWNAGLGVFGVHLVLVGWVIWRWPAAPRLLGPLLLVAGLGYLVDSVGTILRPDLGWGVAAYTFVGEVVLLLWLLRGGPRAPGRPRTDLSRRRKSAARPEPVAAS